jgi:hypothetical protein
VESSFYAEYIDRGVFGISAFESIDHEGVDRLVKMAAEADREVRPDTNSVCAVHMVAILPVFTSLTGLGWTTSPVHPSVFLSHDSSRLAHR